MTYDALQHWVPTLGRVARSTHHDLALLRGAVCRAMRQARARGDGPAGARAEKLLTFLDRLVLHTPRSNRGGKDHHNLDKVISARVRFAWAGDWGALWREAKGSADHAPQRDGRTETAKEQARAVSALIKDGLMGKAVARVLQRACAATGQTIGDALQALFPTGILPTVFTRAEAVSPEVRARLVEEARKAIGRFPTRSGPGPNGSRFEHWGTVRADTDARDDAAEVIVMFLLGECWPDFLRANLGVRMIALRKPNGKIWPVACGSVLRRLAAKAACSALREDIRRACGERQYAVGRRAGCASSSLH